jgi:UDP-3-O-[3-hydroxymyristoyl] glucosamine N-acyltransferase
VEDGLSSYTVSEIAKALSARFVGDGRICINGASEPANAGADQLAVAMERRFADGIAQGQARVAIMWIDADWESFGLEAAILVDRPRLAMAALTTHFKEDRADTSAVHSTAVIDPTADLGDDVSVGPFVVIGANVRIANRVWIASHCSIGDSSSLGPDSVLEHGVCVGQNVRIGANFIAHPSVTIGADGFSFVPDEDAGGRADDEIFDVAPDKKAGQSWLKIQSLGGVKIGDDVEIGANSNIDAGTIRPTFIGDGTKIDALVQVAHNVRIGKHCLLCGQAGMAGSSTLGDCVILGGQAGVADNIVVGDGVIAGGATKIFSNVPAGRTILGNPATKIATQIKMYKALRRLPRYIGDRTPGKKNVSNSRDNT